MKVFDDYFSDEDRDEMKRALNAGATWGAAYRVNNRSFDLIGTFPTMNDALAIQKVSGTAVHAIHLPSLLNAPDWCANSVIAAADFSEFEKRVLKTVARGEPGPIARQRFAEFWQGVERRTPTNWMYGFDLNEAHSTPADRLEQVFNWKGFTVTLKVEKAGRRAACHTAMNLLLHAIGRAP